MDHRRNGQYGGEMRKTASAGAAALVSGARAGHLRRQRLETGCKRLSSPVVWPPEQEVFLSTYNLRLLKEGKGGQ